MLKAQTLSLPKPFFQDAAIVILSSILISLFAYVSIPLPFTPVPLATQENVIFLLAFALGWKRASLAVLGFLFQGAMGLPVFAGGQAGFAILLGPTGGYLFGYLAAALAIGFIAERMREKTSMKAFLAMALGNFLVFLFGAAYLATFLGFEKAIVLGVVPFVLGDLLKLVAATRLLRDLL
jgi:biotin transport system substrate-specific component